jgi:hypothetical protein
MVKLLTDKSAAHMFGLLPVEKAVRWLESMASDDPAALLTFAEAAWAENDARSAVAAWRRAVELDKAGKEKARAAALAEKIDKAAAADAKRFEEAIANDKGGKWIDEFIAYRAKFEFAECAKSAMAAFAKLRQAQQKAANERFDAARADFQKEKKADGYKKCQEIVDLYFASDKYRTAKRWLAERK